LVWKRPGLDPVNPDQPVEPRPSQRLAVACLAAAASAAYVLLFYHTRSPLAVSDFDAIWTAARALRSGHDPYRAIASPPWPWNLQYPLPAVLLGLPFSVLPVGLSRATFMGVSAGLLAWALTRRAWWPLLVMAGGQYFFALQSVQWTPLFTAAVLLIPLRAVWAVKPTTGLPLFAAYPNRWTIAGALALFLAASLVWPGWMEGWLAAVRTAPHRPAILQPGGALLLLALLRWRLPEGRQLAALALVPLSPHLYEALPLALVARNRRELLILMLCGTLGLAMWGMVPHATGQDHGLVPWLIVFLSGYLPPLLLVLSRPPRWDGAPTPLEQLRTS
jgi:hypothetical protein